MKNYTQEELDFLEDFIKGYSSDDRVSVVRNKIQHYRDRILESDLKNKYIGKFVILEDETKSGIIYYCLVSEISVSCPYIDISTRYYIRKLDSDCTFANLRNNTTLKVGHKTYKITEITQEDFDELLISNIVLYERKKTKLLKP